MLGIVAGSLSLFLGWLCFDYVSRVRALYSKERSPHSRFYGEKPLMIFPSLLGVLFVVDGLALVTLAIFEGFQAAGGLENVNGLDMMLIFALLSVTTVVLIRLAMRPRRTKQKAEAIAITTGRVKNLFLEGS